MGKMMSMLSRKAQRFNVENRAHKLISKDKPIPAPRHKPSGKELDVMKQETGGFLEKHNVKDAKLDNRLRDVYLVSHVTEMMEKVNAANPDRPLPKRRTTADELEFGVYEPVDIRKGRCTLRQAVQFITDHNTEPAKHTAADIAAQFNLNPESTSNILKYFRTFKLYIPEVKPVEKQKRPPLPWDKKEPKQLQIQDLCLIVTLTILLGSFFSTYIFRVGLIQLLYSRFRLTLVLCITYLVLSITLHAWHVTCQWTSTQFHPWNKSFHVLYAIHRIVAVIYYYFYKRAALRISDPRLYEGSSWVQKQLSFP